MNPTRVTLIGAGNMGGALAHAWAKSGLVELTISDKNEQVLQHFQQLYPQIKTTTDNRTAVPDAQVVVLVVKPWLMPTVLGEIESVIDLNRQVIVSNAANFGTDKLLSTLHTSGQYFYAIPNIAAEYEAGMTFLAHNAAASAENINMITDLYRLCGKVMDVEEKQVEAGMMMASCGIAYVMRMVRAMTEGGVEMGFYPAQAQQIAIQTMLGAATLLDKSGLHPEVAIDKVTTPGGVTIKGLNQLDQSGFNAAIVKSLKAGLKA